MQDTHRSALLLWSIYFLLPSIFLLDLKAPLGVAVAILYIVPLFGTRWLYCSREGIADLETPRKSSAKVQA